jgi:hypothetical protein
MDSKDDLRDPIHRLHGIEVRVVILEPEPD